MPGKVICLVSLFVKNSRTKLVRMTCKFLAHPSLVHHFCCAHWCGLPLAFQELSHIRDFSHLLPYSSSSTLSLSSNPCLSFTHSSCKKPVLITFLFPPLWTEESAGPEQHPEWLSHTFALLQGSGGLACISPHCFINLEKTVTSSFMPNT